MSHSPSHEPESPVAIDPEHDIDAKTTIAWLSGSLLFVVVILIALGGVFGFSMQLVHYEKIDSIPVRELTDQRAKEAFWLQNPSASADAAAAAAKDPQTLEASEQSIRSVTDRIIAGYLQN